LPEELALAFVMAAVRAPAKAVGQAARLVQTGLQAAAVGKASVPPVPEKAEAAGKSSQKAKGRIRVQRQLRMRAGACRAIRNPPYIATPS